MSWMYFKYLPVQNKQGMLSLHLPCNAARRSKSLIFTEFSCKPILQQLTYRPKVEARLSFQPAIRFLNLRWGWWEDGNVNAYFYFLFVYSTVSTQVLANLILNCPTFSIYCVKCFDAWLGTICSLSFQAHANTVWHRSAQGVICGYVYGERCNAAQMCWQGSWDLRGLIASPDFICQRFGSPRKPARHWWRHQSLHWKGAFETNVVPSPKCWEYF